MQTLWCAAELPTVCRRQAATCNARLPAGSGNTERQHSLVVSIHARLIAAPGNGVLLFGVVSEAMTDNGWSPLRPSGTVKTEYKIYCESFLGEENIASRLVKEAARDLFSVKPPLKKRVNI